MLSQKDYNRNIFFVRNKMPLKNLTSSLKLMNARSSKVGSDRFGACAFISLI